jgi:cobalt-zinc-cadmium efflux system outer membrane protein
MANEDPDMRTSKIGVVVSIPIWDRRSVVRLAKPPPNCRGRAMSLRRNSFRLSQGLEVAYQQYEIAQTQVTALESGIVRQAESALEGSPKRPTVSASAVFLRCSMRSACFVLPVAS